MPSRYVRQGSLDGERDDERAMLHRDAGRPAGKELVAQSVDARAAHVGVVQLVFQSRFAYAGRDIAVGEHGDHASRNGVVRREIERAVADRGDDRSVAVQVAGRATVGQ